MRGLIDRPQIRKIVFGSKEEIDSHQNRKQLSQRLHARREHILESQVSRTMHSLIASWKPRAARIVLWLLPTASLSGVPTVAQTTSPRPWQTIQMPTVAQVRSRWQTPPSEYGPEPYYGMNGPMTMDTVRHDLDTMRALGFRAVTAQYGFGSDRPYLSPAYLQFFREFVMEAKKRDMKVWIVDDAGYPSGFAGGTFTSEHPELRMQGLSATRTQVSGGASFDQLMPPNTVAVTALSRDGQAIAIPFGDGTVQWTAPAGEWTVYAIEHVFRTSPTRSDTNPKRVKDASQSLEDYLNLEAPRRSFLPLHMRHTSG